jgi:hypothetical protein
VKSLLVVLSLLAASSSFAQYNSSPYSHDAGVVDYISWCEKNNVMIVKQDQIVILRNCSETEQTCKVVQTYNGFRSQVAATCQ